MFASSSRTRTGRPSHTRRRLARAAGTVVAAGVIAGFAGAGTASAHDKAPAGGLTSPVGESAGALWHHLEMYHLSDPTWEVTSMLTDPAGNLKVHGQMADDVLSPVVGTAVGALGG
ncbi:hypothetical protein [Streptomyces sp. Ru73]|uniref:hypothetical protein n=1 Tax=Streptomyces sp. Ru73 TaxID=2080748 RepID=UPI0011B0CDF0|nr:hypothetical protein [Streptomyces sp. Ru73]